MVHIGLQCMTAQLRYFGLPFSPRYLNIVMLTSTTLNIKSNLHGPNTFTLGYVIKGVACEWCFINLSNTKYLKILPTQKVKIRASNIFSLNILFGEPINLKISSQQNLVVIIFSMNLMKYISNLNLQIISPQQVKQYLQPTILISKIFNKKKIVQRKNNTTKNISYSLTKSEKQQYYYVKKQYCGKSDSYQLQIYHAHLQTSTIASERATAIAFATAVTSTLEYPMAIPPVKPTSLAASATATTMSSAKAQAEAKVNPTPNT
eukprot:TRINITY_DN11_c0_g1_i7.p1 TRINITY_DN11_c0_g1~~TRINITY_DN11_c0_g1_i7.p1  ORF type:complete len:262 (+),score=-3.47 TRINITY_DN11_c0_g1_i7:560-1345(+)